MPKLIVLNDDYEIVGVTSDFLVLAPFSLIPNKVPLHFIPFVPSDIGHGDISALFILWHEDVDVDVQVMTCSGKIAQAIPPVTRPFGGIDSREEVRREDDKIFR